MYKIQGEGWWWLMLHFSFWSINLMVTRVKPCMVKQCNQTQLIAQEVWILSHEKYAYFKMLFQIQKCYQGHIPYI